MIELTPELITTLGFPVVVTIYLLYERTRFNIKITESLEKTCNTLDKISMQITDLRRWR